MAAAQAAHRRICTPESPLPPLPLTPRLNTRAFARSCGEPGGEQTSSTSFSTGCSAVRWPRLCDCFASNGRWSASCGRCVFAGQNDASLGAMLPIGVAVAVALFVPAAGNILSQKWRRRNLSLQAVRGPEARPILTAKPEEDSAGDVAASMSSVMAGKCDGLLVYCMPHPMSWCWAEYP